MGVKLLLNLFRLVSNVQPVLVSLNTFFNQYVHGEHWLNAFMCDLDVETNKMGLIWWFMHDL